MSKTIILSSELYHHGIQGQKWGVRNGPPYPLDEQNKSKSEKKNKSEPDLFPKVKLSDIKPDKWSEKYDDDDKSYGLSQKKRGYEVVDFAWMGSDKMTQEKLDGCLSRVNEFSKKLDDGFKKKAAEFIYDDMGSDRVKSWTYGKLDSKDKFVKQYANSEPYVYITPADRKGSSELDFEVCFDGGEDFGYHILTARCDEKGKFSDHSIDG